MGMDRLSDELEKRLNGDEDKKETPVWKLLVQIFIAIVFLAVLVYLIFNMDKMNANPCEACMKAYNLSCYNFEKNIILNP